MTNENHRADSCSEACATLKVEYSYVGICKKYIQNEIFPTIIEFIQYRVHMTFSFCRTSGFLFCTKSKASMFFIRKECQMTVEATISCNE